MQTDETEVRVSERRWPTRANLNAISFVALLAGAIATELNNARGTHDLVPGGPMDRTPIVAGIVLGVIVAAFRIGERMQHDTEGLV